MVYLNDDGPYDNADYFEDHYEPETVSPPEPVAPDPNDYPVNQ